MTQEELTTKLAASSQPHLSVLLNEVIEYLNLKDGGSYLDCTFGAGGYTRAIIERANVKVTAIDRDPGVEKFAASIKETFGEKFNFVRGNFSEAYQLTEGVKFDGIVLDLGVSSMQLDTAERGFSFLYDGKLDMRMGQEEASAADFIAQSSEREIADVIYKYGEEVQARQIARRIVEAREEAPITTTLRFAEIVRSAMHFRKAKIDPATKTFQAVRIHVNRELRELELFLENAAHMLKEGGRLVIVSFHSLEDSIVKEFFRVKSPEKIAKSKYAYKEPQDPEIYPFHIVTKKPIVPNDAEVKANRRARSAKLRCAEKIGGRK